MRCKVIERFVPPISGRDNEQNMKPLCDSIFMVAEYKVMLSFASVCLLMIYFLKDLSSVMQNYHFLSCSFVTQNQVKG